MIIYGSDKIQILNKHLKQMPDDQITELITCFPFENMISVNILDQHLIRYCIYPNSKNKKGKITLHSIFSNILFVVFILNFLNN